VHRVPCVPSVMMARLMFLTDAGPRGWPPIEAHRVERATTLIMSCDSRAAHGRSCGVGGVPGRDVLRAGAAAGWDRGVGVVGRRTSTPHRTRTCRARKLGSVAVTCGFVRGDAAAAMTIQAMSASLVYL